MARWRLPRRQPAAERAGANRELPRSLDAHAVGCRVALGDADDCAGLEVVALDEVQELAVLIADAAHADRFVQRAREQRFIGRQVHASLGARNWVAMRIDLGPPEHLVDALDQAIGDGVLQRFGFVVHFGPAHPHHLDEKQLDQPMATQDEGGELLASLRQPHTRIRLVTHES